MCNVTISACNYSKIWQFLVCNWDLLSAPILLSYPPLTLSLFITASPIQTRYHYDMHGLLIEYQQRSPTCSVMPGGGWVEWSMHSTYTQRQQPNLWGLTAWLCVTWPLWLIKGDPFPPLWEIIILTNEIHFLHTRMLLPVSYYN